jgi:hypothetical protein
MRTRALLAACIAVALAGGAGARADSTPIGPLPKGPESRIEATRGSLVAIAVPRRKASTGLVWRVARRVDSTVLQQRHEAEVGSSVVLVFRAVGRGTATVKLGLTRGETARALASASYVVVVR